MRSALRVPALAAAVLAAAAILSSAFRSAPAGVDRPGPDQVRFAPVGPACVKLLAAADVIWVGTWSELPWGALRHTSGRGDAWSNLDRELRELVASGSSEIQVAVDEHGVYEDLLFALYSVRAAGGRPRLAVPGGFSDGNGTRRYGVEPACAPSS